MRRGAALLRQHRDEVRLRVEQAQRDLDLIEQKSAVYEESDR